MFVKKRNAGDADHRVDLPVSVTVEPRPGYSDREVLECLSRESAHDVVAMSPGFISAKINPAAHRALESIAFVHVKPRKQSK